MLTFAFIVLVLVLYGLALWFGYRQARSEFRTALTTAIRRHRRQMRALETRWKLAELTANDFAKRLTILEAITPREGKAIPHSPNPFEQMQNRHAAELKQTLTVNGKQIVPGAK